MSRLRGTKADPRRYEKWPELGECHSGRRIILAFLKKKKKLRESLLLMNSIKAKLQRKRFSAKIIQHGAKLRAARWPKVEGSSQFQNPDPEFPGLSLLVYLIPCVFLNLKKKKKIPLRSFSPPLHFFVPSQAPHGIYTGETPALEFVEVTFPFPP